MKKFFWIRTFCLIFVLLPTLNSCSSIYDHMPETTEPEISADEEDEYFTKGEILSFASYNLGIAYEGLWIYVESGNIVVRDDNPNTSAYDAYTRQYQRLENIILLLKPYQAFALIRPAFIQARNVPFSSRLRGW